MEGEEAKCTSIDEDVKEVECKLKEACLDEEAEEDHNEKEKEESVDNNSPKPFFLHEEFTPSTPPASPLKPRRTLGAKLQKLFSKTTIRELLPHRRRLIVLEANDTIDHCLMVMLAST